MCGNIAEKARNIDRPDKKNTGRHSSAKERRPVYGLKRTLSSEKSSLLRGFFFCSYGSAGSVVEGGDHCAELVEANGALVEVHGIVQTVEELGGEVVKMLFLIELAGLEGRKVLEGYDVDAVVTYEGK